MAIQEVLSPLPGVFYRQASPEKPAFVQVGDTVTENTIIGIVEVMKSFIEIPAEVQGKIVEICVENEQAVEPGQILIKVEGA